MLINDGYNQTCVMGGEEFVFRPLPLSCRRELAIAMKPLSRDGRNRMMLRTINERLVGGFEFDGQGWPESQLAKLWATVIGVDNDDLSDEINLRSGVRLLMLWPSLAQMDCLKCRQHWYYFENGELKLATRDGKPQTRPAETLPCEVSSCPVGHYSKQRRLSEKNLQAFRHYHECRATGSFPDDPIVRRNARVIQWAMQRAVEDRRGRLQCSKT